MTEHGLLASPLPARPPSYPYPQIGGFRWDSSGLADA